MADSHFLCQVIALQCISIDCLAIVRVDQGMMRRRCILSLHLCIWLGWTAALSAHHTPAPLRNEPTVATPTPVRICYQDSALFPYFSGDGHQLPTTRPGATIEHLQYLFARIPSTTPTFQRLPWQRCLKYLSDGKVDLVVANYNIMRRSIGRYPPVPMGAGDDAAPDPAYALTHQDVCLATSSRLAMRWNGKNFSGMNKVTVAHPQSKMSLPPSEQMKMVPYPLQDYSLAPELLEEGRIDAMAVVCRIRGLDAVPKELKHPNFTVLEPPIYVHRGYLVFSHQFANAQPQLVQQIWHQQRQLELQAATSQALDAIYQSYLSSTRTE